MSQNEMVDVELLMGNADENKITLYGLDSETGEAANLNIRLKAFDEKTRKSVDDPDTWKKAVETLRAIGLEEFVTDDGDILTEELATGVSGKSYRAYTKNEDTLASLRPIKDIVRTSKITTSIHKTFNRDLKNQVFESYPVDEWEGGNRFDIKFRAKIDDEIMVFRLSQLFVEVEDKDAEDITLPLRYDKDFRDLRDSLDKNDSLPKNVRESMEKNIESIRNKSRRKMVDRIKDATGMDIESMIENEETVKFTVESTNIPGNDTYFLVGKLVDPETPVTPVE